MELAGKKREAFVAGATYFIVYFADVKMRVPVIQTLVYVQRVRRDKGGGRHQFQELKVEEGKPQTLFLDEAEAADLVLDGDGLLLTLRKCLEGV